MDINDHTSPSKLERYSFLWSEARLVLAAIALFLGGYPLIIKLFGYGSFLYRPAGALLTLSWIISGVSAVYLLYRWNAGGKKLFGGNDKKDLTAFMITVVSGINLGIVGLLGTNIGMNISSSKLVFIVVGVAYLASAYHLHKRWKAYGEKIF